METLRLWITGIAVTSFLLGAAETIVTQKSIKRVLRLCGGMVMLLVLIRPLEALPMVGSDFSGASLSAAIEERTEELQSVQQSAFSQRIEEDMAAYIWDKAAALGLSVEVSVATRAAADGSVTADRVSIKGPYSEELSRWLTEELGVDEAHQKWQEA